MNKQERRGKWCMEVEMRGQGQLEGQNACILDCQPFAHSTHSMKGSRCRVRQHPTQTSKSKCTCQRWVMGRADEKARQAGQGAAPLT